MRPRTRRRGGGAGRFQPIPAGRRVSDDQRDVVRRLGVLPGGCGAGCRRKRSGSTPAGPARTDRGTSSTSASLRCNKPTSGELSVPGSAEKGPYLEQRPPSAAIRRTPGACSTCTATSGSGAEDWYDERYYNSGGRPSKASRRRIRPVPPPGLRVCCVGARGTTTPFTVVPPAASASTPATVTTT